MREYKWIRKYEEYNGYLEVLKIAEHVESVYTNDFRSKYFKDEFSFLKSSVSEWRKYFRQYVIGCFLYSNSSNRLIRKLISMLNDDELDYKLCNEVFYLLNNLVEEKDDLVKMKYVLLNEIDLRKKCSGHINMGVKYVRC